MLLTLGPGKPSWNLHTPSTYMYMCAQVYSPGETDMKITGWKMRIFRTEVCSIMGFSALCWYYQLLLIEASHLLHGIPYGVTNFFDSLPASTHPLPATIFFLVFRWCWTYPLWRKHQFRFWWYFAETCMWSLFGNRISQLQWFWIESNFWVKLTPVCIPSVQI